MKNETRKGFETLGEAAARLLAELERRAKKTKAVPAYSGTEIQPEEHVPASSGKSGEPERIRGEALHGSPQLPVGQPGEKVAEGSGNGSLSASARSEGGVTRRRIANDNICAGRVGFVGSRMHRPASSADLYSDKFTGLESFSETSTARWGNDVHARLLTETGLSAPSIRGQARTAPSFVVTRTYLPTADEPVAPSASARVQSATDVSAMQMGFMLPSRNG